MSADDHFKIDKTAMGEIIGLEDVTADYSGLQGKVRDADVIMEGEEKEETVASEDSTEMELEEILRSCNVANVDRSLPQVPSGWWTI